MPTRVRKSMTVRELINKLLDCRMDAQVMVFTKDPKRPDCNGVIFEIDGLTDSSSIVDIQFTDWRDEVDKREREAK